MNRREFLASTGVFIASTTLVPSARASEGDTGAIKRVVASYYSVYYTERDEQRYRALLADGYQLLDHGDIMDAAADIAAMPKPEDAYKRTDRFDFRAIHVQGDIAYGWYLLNSEISDKKEGQRSRHFVESVVLRRSGNAWRIALLHSTRLSTP